MNDKFPDQKINLWTRKVERSEPEGRSSAQEKQPLRPENPSSGPEVHVQSQEVSFMEKKAKPYRGNLHP